MTRSEVLRQLLQVAVFCLFAGPVLSAIPLFPIATTTANESPGGCAFDGTNYLIGIQGNAVHQASITAQRVSQTGTLVGGRISVGRTGGAPRIAFDGTNYLMVWDDDATYPNDKIYGQFISKTGALVRAPFPISQGAGKFQSMQHIAFDGTYYLVVWSDIRSTGATSVRARRISKYGVLLGQELVLATASFPTDIEVAVAFGGTRYLVAWQIRRDTTPELYDVQGRFVSTAGALSAPFTISQTPSPRHNPLSLCFDGTNYLAAWNHDLSGGEPQPSTWDIMGRIITPAGAMPANAMPLVNTSGSQVLPALAFDGARYLLAWTEGGFGNPTQGRARYLTTTGTPVGSIFTFAYARGSKYPLPGALFYDGQRFLAGLWYLEWGAQGPTNGDVYGTILPAFAHAFRPDGLIRTDSESAYTGDNIYNDTAAQTRTRNVAAGQKAIYPIKVQNDAVLPDGMKVTGTAGGSGWTVQYFTGLTGGTNITAQVTGTGWNAGTLAGGGAKELRVEVTAPAGAASGASKTVLVTVRSTTDGTKFDQVAATTRVQSSLTAVRLAALPASPRPVNTAITLTATPTGGTNVQYKFRAGYYANGAWTWTVLQEYGRSSTCRWQPAEARQYTLTAWVREAGSTATYQAAASLVYQVKPLLTGVSLSATPASPQLANTPITLTASPTGGANVRYQFRVGYQEGGAWYWSTLRSYSTSATCIWTPVVARTYTLSVWAREDGSTAAYQVTRSIGFVVNVNNLTVTGRWEETLPGPGHAGVVGMLLTQTGTTVTGTIIAAPLQEGRFLNRVLTGWFMTTDDNRVDIRLTYSSDGQYLTGNYTIGTTSIPVDMYKYSTLPTNPSTSKPIVLSISPSIGATNVPRTNLAIAITWTKPINGWDMQLRCTVNGQTQVLHGYQIVDSSRITYDSGTKTYTMPLLSSVVLLPNTTYTLILEEGDEVDWHDPYGVPAWTNVDTAFHSMFTTGG